MTSKSAAHQPLTKEDDDVSDDGERSEEFRSVTKRLGLHVKAAGSADGSVIRGGDEPSEADAEKDADGVGAGNVDQDVIGVIVMRHRRKGLRE